MAKSLDHLRINKDKLSERRPSYIRNVKLNIYLDPKDKEKARQNGGKVPVKIDVDKLYQKLEKSEGNRENITENKKPDSVAKTGKVTLAPSASEKIQQSKSPRRVTDNPKLQSGRSCNVKKSPEIYRKRKEDTPEHQESLLDSASKSLTKTQEQDDTKGLIHNKEETIAEGDFTSDTSDDLSIAAVGRANADSGRIESPDSGTFRKRRGTFVVESCGDEVFLLPVIRGESPENEQEKTEEEEVQESRKERDISDDDTFWVSPTSFVFLCSFSDRSLKRTCTCVHCIQHASTYMYV